MKLQKSFYLQSDVVALSKELLGKIIVTRFNGVLTSGIITETEAYKAPEDKASHAYNNKRTSRTETMFSAGGIIYVYLCYGMHKLLNIVTGPKNIPHAILIRGIKPLEGIDTILKRRAKNKITNDLTNGPAKVSQALGIGMEHNGLSLTNKNIFIQQSTIKIKSDMIKALPRIGIDYAEEYKLKPWRFILSLK